MAYSQRYLVPNLASKGVQLSKSALDYSGSDLRQAKNVVIDRRVSAEALVKRPGLAPILTNELEGPIRGLVSVPLSDPNEVPVRYLAAGPANWRTSLNGQDWENLTSINPTLDPAKYVNPLKLNESDCYALRLADASGVQVYYVSDSFFPDVFTDYPSQLRSSDAESDILVEESKDSSLVVVTAVRTVTTPNGEEILYIGALRTPNMTTSDLVINTINLATGVRSRVPLDISSYESDDQDRYIITSIFYYDAVPFYLLAKSGGGGWLLSPDGAVAAPISDDLIPLSLNIIEGMAYVGCSNSIEHSARAAILQCDLGQPEPTFVSRLQARSGLGRAAFTALTTYAGHLYTILTTSSPTLSMAIYRLDPTDLYDSALEYSIGQDLPDIQFAGQGRVIKNDLFFTVSGRDVNDHKVGAILRKHNNNWEIVDYAPVNGPIVGMAP